ncbi:MAG: hypothetical protein NT137_05900 [Methanomassiliicoccales archaeon]|nr:hypothetical protein [Methanomassiliicoccales archaeon]
MKRGLGPHHHSKAIRWAFGRVLDAGAYRAAGGYEEQDDEVARKITPGKWKFKPDVSRQVQDEHVRPSQIISKEEPEQPQPVQPTNQQPAPAYQQQYQQPPQQYAPPQDQQYQPPQNRQP